ncbi:MAG: thermonuclease family protein [Campylobacterales bacterium]
MKTFALLLAPIFLFGFQFYGILKLTPSAVVPVFYNKDYGYVECYMFGVSSSDNVQKTDCNITKRDKKLMDHYTRGFVYNTLHIEQKYKIEMVDGLCKIYNGAHVYNYQLAREGYAFLSLANITKKNEEIVKIRDLVEKAKNQRVGLWKEWRDEMSCLESEAAQNSALPENWDEEG